MSRIMGLVMLVVVWSYYVPPASGQTAAPSMAVVTADAAVFTEADLSSAVLRLAAAGSVLKVSRLQDDWAEVEFADPRHGTRVGWIRQSAIRIASGFQPLNLSVGEHPAAPVSRGPCVIVKIYQKRTADAFTRWTVPKPYNYVEGEFPAGFRFRNELNDKHVREIQDKGGHVVVIKPDYALPDLQDARTSCRAWQESLR